MLPNTASQSWRSLRINFPCDQRSPNALTRNFFVGSAAATLVIPRLEIRPNRDSDRNIAAGTICFPRNVSTQNAPATLPAISARNVPNSKMPFPHDKRFVGNSSGSSPYLDGPKRAFSVLARNTAASIILRSCRAKANPANTNTMISKSFVPIVTVRLLNRSARYPPVIENRMKGKANIAPTRNTSQSR